MVDQSEQQPQNVQPAAAKELLDGGGGYILLDVRCAPDRMLRRAQNALGHTAAAAASAAAQCQRQSPAACRAPALAVCARAHVLYATHSAYVPLPPLPTPRRTPEEHAQGAVPGSINVPIKLQDASGAITVSNEQFLEQARPWLLPRRAGRRCGALHGCARQQHATCAQPARWRAHACMCGMRDGLGEPTLLTAACPAARRPAAPNRCPAASPHPNKPNTCRSRRRWAATSRLCARARTAGAARRRRRSWRRRASARW